MVTARDIKVYVLKARPRGVEGARGIGIIHLGHSGCRGVARAVTVGPAVITIGGEDRLGTVVGDAHSHARGRGGDTHRNPVPVVREGDLSTGSTLALKSQALIRVEIGLGELPT